MIDIKKLDGLYQQHLADHIPDTTKMMPTGKDSLQVQAMKEALTGLNDYPFCDDERILSVISILHQVIEQAEKQKPVAESEEGWNGWLKRDVYFEYGEPLMHSEPEWVGLTDEEILNLYTGITKSAWDCIMYARVIEARLKGMNHEPRQYKDLCGND